MERIELDLLSLNDDHLVERVIQNNDVQNCLQELADYKDAEEQGLLVRLPCKVEDTVYYPFAKRVIPKVVSDFRQHIYNGKLESWFCVNEDECDTFDIDAIGKTVFLTESEAQAAIKK